MNNILPIEMLGMFGKKSLQQLAGVWSMFFLYLGLWSNLMCPRCFFKSMVQKIDDMNFLGPQMGSLGMGSFDKTGIGMGGCNLLWLKEDLQNG